MYVEVSMCVRDEIFVHQHLLMSHSPLIQEIYYISRD